MPFAPVVVEFVPPDTAAQLRTTLLDACSSAAEGTSCVDAATPGDTAPLVVATVTWKDAAHAEIRVTRRRESGVVVRDLTFGAGDPPDERFRAAGLVVGTLASVLSPPGKSSSDGAGTATAETPAHGDDSDEPPVFASERDNLPAPPSTSIPSKARRGSFAIAGLAGSALDRGPLRVGAELEGRVQIEPSGWFMTAGFAFSESAARLESVRTTWVQAFGGTAFERDVGGSFAASVHAEGFCEELSADVRVAGDETPTDGGRLAGGARLGADLVFRGAEPIAFFAGGSGSVTFGTTTIRTGDKLVGIAPALGYTVRIGMRYEF